MNKLLDSNLFNQEFVPKRHKFQYGRAKSDISLAFLSVKRFGMEEKMNQQKTGRFIKELRGERKLTQEQLAEIFGVSNRSVSRWENGINMPDLDLLIQLAKYFDVGIEELLDGERRKKDMDKKSEETLLKVADYSNVEKEFFSKRIRYVFIAELIGMAIYMAIDLLGLMDVQPYAAIVDFALGVILGASIVGLLYSSRYITKIKAVKMRLLKRLNNFHI